MYSKCINLSPLPFVSFSSLGPPLLSSCVCCAVSVDLWYRSQGPLLTAHLYLYCRDTAHSDRKGEPGPCGHKQKERERDRRREWVSREERKTRNKWVMDETEKKNWSEREGGMTKYHHQLQLTTYPPQREPKDPIPCRKSTYTLKHVHTHTHIHTISPPIRPTR